MGSVVSLSRSRPGARSARSLGFRDSRDPSYKPGSHYTGDGDSTANTRNAVERKAVTHHRSHAVRMYVLRRANGHCEGCGAAAPSRTNAGRPYIEPHHIRRLTDGSTTVNEQGDCGGLLLRTVEQVVHGPLVAATPPAKPPTAPSPLLPVSLLEKQDRSDPLSGAWASVWCYEALDPAHLVADGPLRFWGVRP
mgnify:CR=1 FL=1